MIKSIAPANFLSCGPTAPPVELRALNAIIGPNGPGPNGSKKSNLIESLELLRATPKDLLTPVREGRGARDWLWKGATRPPIAAIDAGIENSKGPRLRYVLSFTEVGQRFEIAGERIENESPDLATSFPHQYYEFERGRVILNARGVIQRRLPLEDIDRVASILSQDKDPDRSPELAHLGNIFAKMRLYKEWSFGRYTIPRLPRKADLPNEPLEPDASHPGLVLNRLCREPAAKKRFLEALRVLYEDIDDFGVQIEERTVQGFLRPCTIPATRLSDGTLRYLCSLAILCHPAPRPLICIEEPEPGLHPDVLPTLAQLLKDASEHTQPDRHNPFGCARRRFDRHARGCSRRRALGNRHCAPKVRPGKIEGVVGKIPTWTALDTGGYRGDALVALR